AQDEPIGVRLRVDDGSVLIAMRDLAFTFDVAAHASTRRAPPPEKGQRGGMGLFIVYSMCESFEHRVPREGGNVVFLRMKLPRRQEAPAADAATPTRNVKEEKMTMRRKDVTGSGRKPLQQGGRLQQLVDAGDTRELARRAMTLQNVLLDLHRQLGASQSQTELARTLGLALTGSFACERLLVLRRDREQ